MKYFFSTSFILFISLISIAQRFPTEMIPISGGSFIMGNAESEISDEYPAHTVILSPYLIGKVTITHPFWIGKYEVTIGLYKRFCMSSGKKIPKGTDQHPAHSISWNDAIYFCNWLSIANGKKQYYNITKTDKNVFVKTIPESNGYRLPTEAEWEYAARGAEKTKFYSYSGANNANDIAWYLYSGHEIKVVGQKKPNEIGLYDMSGNLLELCYDYYNKDYYKKKESNNPTGPKYGTKRVARGGSFQGSSDALRVSKRFSYSPENADKTRGFRLARNPD